MKKMGESSENEKDIGHHIGIVLYRLPKKNHDAMVSISKPFNEFFKKYGVLHWEVFQLDSSRTMEPFTNISKTVSATEDEELWIELFTFNDGKHRDEVMTKMEQMQGDKSCEEIFKQFMNLISPGSSVVTGDFGSIKGLGF
ncbi:MAG: hypothetical protein DA329_09855 [Candidatus Nitrosocosmicus sp.]|nr:hypothetical protein [Candidatus Nitrosocosmicus sp.]